MTGPPWTIEIGDDLADPVVATAIHAGHGLRHEVAAIMALPEAERLREEDPFTDRWVGIAENRIVVDRSRFEVDVNRSPEEAVYRVPDDAWGLDIWKESPPDDLVARSLELHRRFYAELGALCDRLVEARGRVVVLDLHSYNHRRAGAEAPAGEPIDNPVINIGTATIDRSAWEPVIQAFARSMAARPIVGTEPDVRFDVKFGGGHMMRWLNARHPGRCCAIAVEVKKVYMDEWTGRPDEDVIARVGALLDGGAQAIRRALA